MTIAEKVLADYADDGGRTDACDGYCESYAIGPSGESHWLFADGSAVVSDDGAWGIGYAECFCWREHGHGQRCRPTREL